MFTNEQIDTAALPRYESVTFKKLERAYLKVIFINIGISVLVVAAIVAALYIWVDDFSDTAPYIIAGLAVLFGCITLWSVLNFFRRGYAFREHDVLYKSGVLSTSIMVIPYNRVQHVALHEGLVARMFGYAQVKVYTAGGGSGDLGVSGIPVGEAQDIKQLLMGKIQKTLE